MGSRKSYVQIRHLIIQSLILLASCSSPTVEQEKNTNSNLQVNSSEFQDTTFSSSPIQIGNDKGQVEITGIQTFKNDTLTNGEFTIQLKDVACCPLTKTVNQSMVIDSNTTVHFLDSLHRDYTSEAVLSSVTFDFVRGATLYFNAELENVIEGKRIYGRFNLFYQSDRKGEVYGWITDSLKTQERLSH